jgi:Ni,Fe-hydrogenase III small subunit/ferredoxin
MANPLLIVAKTGIVTKREWFPDLTPEAHGLPAFSLQPCVAGCRQCAAACPTEAVTVTGQGVLLDRGLCLGCNACVRVCPAGTLVPDRSVKTAVRTRGELRLASVGQPLALPATAPAAPRSPFYRSLQVREVSTGDSASDAEVNASTNADFDVSRFGISFVASPRFADALLVTGPVGRAMQEPLRRCYEAMAEPRLVIAAGVSAISGGLHRGGYATAEGVDGILPVAAYIPGDPPHPRSIIHGLLLAMGRL